MDVDKSNNEIEKQASAKTPAERFQEVGSGKLGNILDILESSMVDAPLTYDREQIKDLLQTRLDPDEKILWYGQPDAALAEKRSSRWFWLGGAIIMAVIAFFIGPIPNAWVYKAASGLFSVLFAYFALVSPRYEKNMARVTLYAVTNKQVLKFQATSNKAPGTKVRWLITRHFNKSLIDPIKKQVASNPIRSDVTFAIQKSDDSSTTHTMTGIADADKAVMALYELRRLLESTELSS